MIEINNLWDIKKYFSEPLYKEIIDSSQHDPEWLMDMISELPVIRKQNPFYHQFHKECAAQGITKDSFDIDNLYKELKSLQ